ncbi:MAG: hypothetical protein QM803_21380 [Rhodocyclaceae bacterium]
MSGGLGSRLSVAVGLGLLLNPAAAQTTIGPSPPTVTTTVTVTSGTTTVVGSTDITPAQKVRAAVVSGGTLVLDAQAGPAPGPVRIRTDGANALVASGTGTIQGNAITVNTTNIPAGSPGGPANGSNVSVTTGGTVSLDNSTLTSSGNSISAASGTVNLRGVSITSTTPGTSQAISATGATGRVVADGISLTASGHGLYAATGATIVFRNSTLAAPGARAGYVLTGATFEIYSSTITGGSSGLTAQPGGTIWIDVNPGDGLPAGSTTNVSAAGTVLLINQASATANAGRITASRTNVTSQANSAAGVWAQGGTATLTDSTISTQGANAYGTRAGTLLTRAGQGPATVTLQGTGSAPATIDTAGEGAFAIWAWGDVNRPVVTADNVAISTTGANAYGAAAGNIDTGGPRFGQVTVTGGSLTTAGDFSAGVLSWGTGSEATATSVPNQDGRKRRTWCACSGWGRSDRDRWVHCNHWRTSAWRGEQWCWKSAHAEQPVHHDVRCRRKWHRRVGRCDGRCLERDGLRTRRRRVGTILERHHRRYQRGERRRRKSPKCESDRQ